MCFLQHFLGVILALSVLYSFTKYFLYVSALMPLVLCFKNHISMILVTRFVLLLVKMSNDSVLMSNFTSHTLLCFYILLLLITWILGINKNMPSNMTLQCKVHPIVLFWRLLSYSKRSNSHSKSWCQNNIFKCK